MAVGILNHPHYGRAAVPGGLVARRPPPLPQPIRWAAAAPARRTRPQPL